MKKYYPHNLAVAPSTLAAIRSRLPLALESFEYRPDCYQIGHGQRGYVPRGMRITPLQAESLFRNDVMYVEARIRLMLDRPISDPAYQALVSFVFDVGAWNPVLDDTWSLLTEGNEKRWFSMLPGAFSFSRYGENVGKAARFWEAKLAEKL